MELFSFLAPPQLVKITPNKMINKKLYFFMFLNFNIRIYNLILLVTMLLQKYKKVVYLQRQVLHDQLLQTPPGWEHSKGTWLSGAM